jgi:hypothetical protein
MSPGKYPKKYQIFGSRQAACPAPTDGVLLPNGRFETSAESEEVSGIGRASWSCLAAGRAGVDGRRHGGSPRQGAVRGLRVPRRPQPVRAGYSPCSWNREWSEAIRETDS